MSRKITRRDLRKMILNEIRLLSEGFSMPMFQKDLEELAARSGSPDGFMNPQNLAHFAKLLAKAHGVTNFMGMNLGEVCQEIGLALGPCAAQAIGKELMDASTTLFGLISTNDSFTNSIIDTIREKNDVSGLCYALESQIPSGEMPVAFEEASPVYRFLRRELADAV